MKDTYTSPYNNTPAEASATNSSSTTANAITTALTMGADIIRQKMEESGLPAAQAWVLSKEAKELIETIRTVHGVGEDSGVTKDTGAAKDTGTTEGIAGSTASAIPNDPTSTNPTNTTTDSSSTTTDSSSTTTASPSIFDALANSMADVEAEKAGPVAQGNGGTANNANGTANNSLLNTGTLVAGPGAEKRAPANSAGPRQSIKNALSSTAAKGSVNAGDGSNSSSQNNVPFNYNTDIPLITEISRITGKYSIDEIAKEIDGMTRPERNKLFAAFIRDPQLKKDLLSGDPDTFNRYVALTCGTQFMREYAAFNAERTPLLNAYHDPAKSPEERWQAKKDAKTLTDNFVEAHRFKNIVDKSFQQQERQRGEDWLAQITSPEMSKRMLTYVDQLNQAKPGEARTALLGAMLNEAAKAVGPQEGKITIEENMRGDAGRTRGNDSRFNANLLVNKENIDFDFIMDTLLHERMHALQYTWTVTNNQNLAYLKGFGMYAYDPAYTNNEDPYLLHLGEQHARFVGNIVKDIVKKWRENAQ